MHILMYVSQMETRYSMGCCGIIGSIPPRHERRPGFKSRVVPSFPSQSILTHVTFEEVIPYMDIWSGLS